MAATTWHTLTRFAPRQWLLANGTIISEPVLEQTTSGRKVRVQGEKDSVFYGELDNLLARSANEQAAAVGSAVLTEVTDFQDNLHAILGFDPANNARAQLHVLRPEAHETVAWWSFQLPNTPYEAYLVASIHNASMWNRPQATALSFALYMPQVQQPMNADRFTRVTGENFPDWHGVVRWHPDDGLTNYYVWETFFDKNKPNWDAKLLRHWEVFEGPRLAVQQLLKIVRSIEQEEVLQVPNAGDLAHPSWLTLELTGSNVNSEFTTDMVEYLDTDAAAERILDLYDKIRNELRYLGILTNEKNQEEFIAAVMSGDKAKFSMEITNPLTEGGYDTEHTLSVHLPTGTFVVECNHREPKNQILEEWEQARTIAALGGEEDELLAYARAYAKKNHKRRSKTIIKARKGND